MLTVNKELVPILHRNQHKPHKALNMFDPKKKQHHFEGVYINNEPGPGLGAGMYVSMRLKW